MMEVLKMASFNCKGLNSAKIEIARLCDSHSIICLQELWLFPNDLSLLGDIHPDFNGTGVSAMDPSKQLYTGRPYGGVGIMWNKSLDNVISSVDTGVTWMSCIRVEYSDVLFYVISVYLPYEKNDHYDEYMECIGKMESFMNECNSSVLYVLGDFNTDVMKNTVYSSHLICFIERTKCIMSDHFFLEDAYTYVSDAWGTTSWLDHCIATEDAHHAINDIAVLYDYVTSDHKPISVELNMSRVPECSDDNRDNIDTKIHWNNIDSDKIEMYRLNTGKLFDEMYDSLKRKGISCCDPNCKDAYHISDIDCLYNELIYVFDKSSECLINRNCRNLPFIPGWNEFVKDSHEAARVAFHMWCRAGRPRIGPMYETIKRCRSVFKNTLKFCRKNEQKIKADRLAKNLFENDHISFWKEVKKQQNCKVAMPSCIEGVRGTANIANMWQQHFDTIFNSVRETNKDINTVNEFIKSVEYCDTMNVSGEELKCVINSLKNGKSCGNDKISAEHLKYADLKLFEILSCLFKSMFIHGYIPEKMLISVIVPVVKNKNTSLCIKKNYRPVTLSSVISKVFEYIILSRIEKYIETADNQFGFKKGQGTEMCVFVLKELVRYYKSQNSGIFICYLDASMAFDKIRHSTLFKKLISRDVPVYLVRILWFWYRNQSLFVKWQNKYSKTIKVNNGVRQGGIISPRLFNLYMDKLSMKLNSVNVGCCIKSLVINHLMYADDLALIAPSVKGLQTILDICYEYGLSHNIMFNESKSVCMHFKQSKQISFEPVIWLGNDKMNFVTKYKYLGHIINCDLTDDNDVQAHVGTFYARANMLIRKFNFSSDSSKIYMFKTFCSNIYCCSLWCKWKTRSVHRIRVAYNNCFRILLKLPRFCSASGMFVERRVPSFDEIIRKSKYSILCRIKRSNNILVKSIYLSDVYYTSHFFCDLYDCLYV